MALRISTGLRNKLLGINTTKLVNGTFDSATTSWTAVTATLTSEASGQSGNHLRVAEAGGADPGKAYQDVTTKVGHLYMVSYYFKKGDADAGKLMIGTTAVEAAIYDSGALTDADWAYKQTWFLATEVTTRVTCQSTDATVGEYSGFDTIIFTSMTRALQDVFKDGFINIYTGTQPTLASDAVAGTLLVTIYSNGTSTGLEFDDASAGVISKKSTETWSGTAGNTGTAGWFRMYAAGDALGSSSVDERLDGACGTSGSELNMSSTSIVSGAVQSISTFQITMPAA